MVLDVKRHNTIHCIMEYHDQCMVNGLAFMPVRKYRRYFFFSFLLDVDFMTLNILNLDDSYFIFFIFPKFFINLRASLQIFVENHQFHVVLSCFKQVSDNYVFNVSSCTILASSSRICRLFLNNNLAT